MALAPYFGRVGDAVGALTAITAEDLEKLLESITVHVQLGPATATDPAWRDGAGLLINLLARLYPTIQITGPHEIVTDLTKAARAINPAITFAEGTRTRSHVIAYPSGPGTDVIAVDAAGWVAGIDTEIEPAPPSVFTTMTGACLGAAELFRTVFADELGERGRRGPQPGTITLTDADVEPGFIKGLVLPPMSLAGAGAVGQAAVLALAASGATGTMKVVDPEVLELSNLQRYVLSHMHNLGVAKVDLVGDLLTPLGWTVERVQTVWGADARSGPGQNRVLVALDSAKDRIGLAGGLHANIYNAWTQPADLGVSRHTRFGDEPCLACLYFPLHERPGDDEVIANALGEHRLRILSYFTTNVPVGAPLPIINEIADVPLPPEAGQWTSTPLIVDLVNRGIVPGDDMARWAVLPIGALYNHGICGGGLIRVPGSELAHEVVVPVVHQSALAGILLAFEAVADASGAGAGRPVETRIDLLAGLPQITHRPRARTPRCICSDPDYVEAYNAQKDRNPSS